VPYKPSGSTALLSASIDSFLGHHLVLWLNHGFVSRSLRIERAYALLAYAEQAAEVTLSILRYGGRGLPVEYIKNFLRSNRLLANYRRLKLKSSRT
jgi:ribulose-5-phosphate 4-epimerase/fuculose-1-phosphate aldolase